MGASLSWTITESNVNTTNNTSKVTVKLRITATGSTYNGYSQSGWIKIDGTKYSFSHSFSQGTTTTLATKSKTVTHNADGSKKCAISCSYNTGVSPGTLTKSTTKTLTKINRNVTVTLNANGGSVSPVTLTKTAGAALTLPIPTLTNYTFKGWCTTPLINTNLPSGETNYGNSYNGNNAITLYAMWSSNYIIEYDSNTGQTFPPVSGVTPQSSHDYLTPKLLTKNGYSREGLLFSGWTFNNYIYNDEEQVVGLTSTAGDTIRLQATWTPKTYRVSYNYNGGSGTVTESTLSHYGTINLPDSTGITHPNNYNFAGWSKTQCSLNDTSKLAYAPGAVFQEYGDITLYAVWVNAYVPPRASIQAYRVDGEGRQSSGGRTVSYVINYSLSRVYSNNTFGPGNGVEVTITIDGGTPTTQSYSQDGVISGDFSSYAESSIEIIITDTTQDAPTDSKTTSTSIIIPYVPNISPPTVSRTEVGRLAANQREGYFNFAWEGGYDGDTYSSIQSIQLYKDITELDVNTGEEVIRGKELFKTITYSENPLPKSGYVTAVSDLNPTFPLNTSNIITAVFIDENNNASDHIILGIISYGSLVVHIPGDLSAVTLFGFTQKGETGLVVNKGAHFKGNITIDNVATIEQVFSNEILLYIDENSTLCQLINSFNWEVFD